MMAIDHFLSRKEDSKLRESTLKIHKSFKNTQTTEVDEITPTTRPEASGIWPPAGTSWRAVTFTA